MLFDSHAHYDDSRFDEDRDFVLSLMQENNVGKILKVISTPSVAPFKNTSKTEFFSLKALNIIINITKGIAIIEI